MLYSRLGVPREDRGPIEKESLHVKYMLSICIVLPCCVDGWIKAQSLVSQ